MGAKVCGNTVREKHGRWGLTASKKLGATAEPEYNVQLSSERGLVVNDLNALLNGWLPGEQASGVRRDSGASGAAVQQSVKAGSKGRGKGQKGGSRGNSNKGKGRGRARGAQKTSERKMR